MIPLKHIKILFKDRFTVKRKVLITENNISRQKEMIIYQDMKGKFSYRQQKQLIQEQTASFTNQYTLHYSSLDYEIKTGDKILYHNEVYIVGEIIFRGEYNVCALTKEVKA